MKPFALLAKKLLGQRPLTRQDRIEQESLVGGTLFGIAPLGMTRQFFYMSDNNWFYISTVKDAKGLPVRSTIRYHVQPDGVIKSIDGKGHVYIEGEEYATFIDATRRYLDAIAHDVYNQTPKRYSPSV